MNPEFWLQVAGMVGAAVTVYSAIRADLREMKIRAEAAQKAADEAHGRLDRHIELSH